MAEAISSQATTAPTQTSNAADTAAKKKHNAGLVSQGRDLILNLNASDKEVYEFINKAISSDDTDPATIGLLQQLLQKRMEKSGLLTNMIRMFGDAAMRVIGNIGR